MYPPRATHNNLYPGTGRVNMKFNHFIVYWKKKIIGHPFFSEDEGYILAEKMIAWLQKFTEKLMILRGLRAQLLPPHQKYPVVLKAAPSSQLRSPARYAYSDLAARDLDYDSVDDTLLDYPQKVALYPRTSTNGLDEYEGLKSRKEEADSVDLIGDGIDDSLSTNPQTLELGGQGRAVMKRGGVATADTRVHRRRSKRNPRCLHTCLKRGYLHPAQCHALC